MPIAAAAISRSEGLGCWSSTSSLVARSSRIGTTCCSSMLSQNVSSTWHEMPITLSAPVSISANTTGSTWRWCARISGWQCSASWPYAKHTHSRVVASPCSAARASIASTCGSCSRIRSCAPSTMTPRQTAAACHVCGVPGSKYAQMSWKVGAKKCFIGTSSASLSSVLCTVSCTLGPSQSSSSSSSSPPAPSLSRCSGEHWKNAPATLVFVAAITSTSALTSGGTSPSRTSSLGLLSAARARAKRRGGRG